MRPEKGTSYVQIPLTFDGKYRSNALTNDKFIISAILLLVWFILWVFLLNMGSTVAKIVYTPLSLLVLLLIIRFVVMREKYYMQKRRDLVQQDYKYTYNVFWDIHDVSEAYPYICRYTRGLNAVFVQFDKDVIVGQPDNNDYLHYEAIAEAYSQMLKRGIDCMHIDYMDTVGKDKRMESLFQLGEDAKNPDIQDVLMYVFSDVKEMMCKSYATYDVYCFYFQGRDEIFWEELQLVLDYFNAANYIGYTILDKRGISELVEAVMNVSEFSVDVTADRLYAQTKEKKHLKVIWVEKAGELLRLNKTREELAEEQKTRQAEIDLQKMLKKKRKTKLTKLKDKVRMEEDIDILGVEEEELDIVREEEEIDILGVEEEEIDILGREEEEIDILGMEEEEEITIL